MSGFVIKYNETANTRYFGCALINDRVRGNSGMRKHTVSGSDEMVSQLFFKLLPVQVGLVAMWSMNSIVDGIVAGRFIDPATVGVVGLYYTMVRVLEAVGDLLLGGSSVLCGRYLGSGKVEKTRGVCSLSLTIAFCVGMVLTLVSFLATGPLSRILGADEMMIGPLSTYARGYAIGIVPQLMGQQFAMALQLERKDKRGEAGIAAMILTNAGLDLLLVGVLDMGVWGLALATSIGNWVYFVIVAGYYLGRNAQLKPDLKLVDWKEMPSLIKIGAPSALLVVCLAMRNLVINHILVQYSGPDGLSALSAFNLSSGLILSFALGTGAVVRILSSVFLGEENREGLLSLMKIVLTRTMAITLVLSAAVSVLAPFLSGIFFPDSSSQVFLLTRQLFFIYGFTMPFSFLCILYSSYGMAAGFTKYVHMISLMDGFFSMVIPSVLLAPIYGAMGVWYAFPIGLVITLGVTVGYIWIRNRHWPKNAAEWLLLPPDLGTREHLVLSVREEDQIVNISMKVQRFCDTNGLAHRIGLHAGLCMEEMALNIFQHGFSRDSRRHSIEIRVVLREDDVMLRIKDDGIAFNPKEWYEMMAPSDPVTNIGIRLVYRISDEMNYHNLLGMNVLTICFKKQEGV